jgi:hypothetical protein
MALPNQLIPEEEKTIEWAEACINAIERGYNDQNDRKERVELSRRIYNGTIHQDEYQYLTTREGGKDKNGNPNKFRMPAKVRHIPIIRPMLNMLESINRSRPLVFRAFANDEESIKKKEDLIYKEYITRISTRANQKMMALQQQQQLIAQQAQLLQQQQEQEGGLNETDQTQLAEIKSGLAFAQQVIDANISITSEEIDEINKYFKYSYKSMEEEQAEKIVSFLLKTKKLENVFNMGFKEKLITDEEYYFCDWEPGMRDPVFRKVHPENLTYSIDEEVEYIGQSSWIAEVQEMSLPHIIDEFPELTEDQIKIIQTYAGGSYYQHGRAISNLEGTDLEGNAINETSFNNHYTGSNYNIRVTRVYWKSPTRIWMKRTPNKHQKGKYFTHFISHAEAQKHKQKKKSNAKLIPLYRTDLWGGVKIGDAVYTRVGKRPVQLRKNDQKSDVDLPYIGFLRNRYNEPHSMVWQSRDLQELYNIIHYHIELWVALAGVKGVIFDRSQKPTGISNAEWMMQVKQGIMEIETVKPGDKRRQSQFNQHGATYDHTISPAIQYLISINEQIRALAGEVIGITRARMGQTQRYDQVGTTEMSNQQSSVATEYLHQEHEELKAMALSRMVNLCKLAWRKGKKGKFVLGDMGQHTLNITKEHPLKGDFQIYIDSGGKHMEALRNLRQLSMDGYQKGKYNIAQLARLYDIDSIQQLEKQLQHWEDVAIQKAQMNEQQKMEQMAQIEQQKQQMEAQITMMVEQEKNKMKNLELELKRQELGLKAQELQIRAENDKLRIESDIAMKKMDISAEASVEMSYLKQKDEMDRINAKLKEIELMIKSNTESAKLSSSGDSGGGKSKVKIKDDNKTRK